MKRPRFTDADRFAAAYVNSGATNVAATFARIRRQQAEATKKAAADELERVAKLAKRTIKGTK